MFPGAGGKEDSKAETVKHAGRSLGTGCATDSVLRA